MQNRKRFKVTCFLPSYFSPVTAPPRGITRLSCLQLCKRAGRLGLRGTSPLRKKGKSGDSLSFEKPLSSRAPSLLRYSRNHFDPVDSNGPHGAGGSTRSWTTGELVENDPDDGATTAGAGGSYEGGVQSRARSADGATLSALLVDSDLGSAAEQHPDDAVDPLHTKADGLVGSAEESGWKDASDFFGAIGADGEGKQEEKLEERDGAGVDDDDNDDLEFPRESSQQIPRRVSFADEQADSDGSDGGGDSTEEPSGQAQHRVRRVSQRRRMSSIIGSSDGYLEGDGSINGQIVDNNGRRKSDLERCRRAMEIAKVAHDLLFLDTRPDGLRPITGTPMSDGKNAHGSGGLYVGLAGLRGFDLSFVGAAPTNSSDSSQSLGSVAARLAAHRRLSAHAAAAAAAAAAANNDESSVTEGARDTPTASASKANASWMAQGFLLDRKPGSLMPRLPRSAGRAPAAEMGQTLPKKSNSSNSGVNDEGRVDAPTSDPVGSNRTSPEANEGKRESPLSPVSRSKAQQTHTPAAAEDDSNAAKAASSTASALAKEDGDQAQDARDRRDQISSGDEECGKPLKEEGTRSESEGNSTTSAPEDNSGTTVVSHAATTMASLFAPKAAVLWSARDLGVDDLVFSVAGDQEVRKCLRVIAAQEFVRVALVGARPAFATMPAALACSHRRKSKSRCGRGCASNHDAAFALQYCFRGRLERCLACLTLCSCRSFRCYDPRGAGNTPPERSSLRTSRPAPCLM